MSTSSRLTPRYRLIYDSIGRSLPLPIARRLGLPAAILDTAAGVAAWSTRAAQRRTDARAHARASRRDLAEADSAARAALTDNAAESTRLLGELRERRRTRLAGGGARGARLPAAS